MSASAEDGAALQQFCLLAKSAKGAACASLIGQALEHPGVFVFGELLDMPSVKEARANSTTRRSAPRLTVAQHAPFTHGAPSLGSSRARPRRRISSCSSSSRGELGPITRARARAPCRAVLTHHKLYVCVHCVCTACAHAAHHAAPGRSLHAARASPTRLSHALLAPAVQARPRSYPRCPRRRRASSRCSRW